MEILNVYEKRIIEMLIEGERTLSQISKNLKLSKPSTSKYLRRLEEKGIVEGEYIRDRNGRSLVYRLRSFHLIFSIDPDKKILIYLEADEPLDIDNIYLGYIPQRDFRKEVREYISEVKKAEIGEFLVILYGSVAKGEGHRKSDIDMLFLKDEWRESDKDRILDLLANASSKCKHRINPVFKTIDEFETLDRELKKEIDEYGIIIYEKGKRWNQIKQKMRRYRSITI